MNENKVNQILDDFVSESIAYSYQMELAEKIVKSPILKEALLDRCIELNNLHKDCNHFIGKELSIMQNIDEHRNFLERDIRELKAANDAEDLLKRYNYFKGSLEILSISFLVDNEYSPISAIDPKLVRQFLEAYQKHDALSIVGSLFLHNATDAKVTKEYIEKFNEEYWSIFDEFLPQMKNLEYVFLESPVYLDEEEQITLGDISFASLPNFSENPKLAYVFLNNFYYTEDLKKLHYIPALKHLEFSRTTPVLSNRNYFEDNSFCLENLKIKELHLKNLDIKNFPKEIATLKNLERLNLEKNQIETLPNFLENMPLKELNVSQNLLKNTDNIPFSTLNKLHLDYNKIEKLDSKFAAYLVLGEMLYGQEHGQKQKLINGVSMTYNLTSENSLPKEIWKQLLDVFEADKLANKIGVPANQKKLFINEMEKIIEKESLSNKKIVSI